MIGGNTMIYFTADLHFGHTNVIRYCGRPFGSVEDMDAGLIRNWNATVSRYDEVYILGDLTMKPPAAAHQYLATLNGRKYMIRGNHDRFLDRFEPYASDFEWIKDYYVLKHEGRKLVLFHYPIFEWADFYHGAIHLFGHVHNAQASEKRLVNLTSPAFNVGVDCNDYRPISIVDIILMAERSQGEP